MRRARFIFIMVLPAILFPMIFTYYPMIKGSLMAFQSYNLMNVKNIKWVGLENFSKLFAHNTSNTFYSTMLNTVKWVGISLFVQFTVGFAMALLLKKKFKGSSLYQGLIFFPWAVSGFIIGIMWRWMFNGTSGVINDLLMRIHLISQPVGWLASKNTALYSCIIANIWYGIPFFTIMITAALRGVSEDLYEAADVDGASPPNLPSPIFWILTSILSLSVSYNSSNLSVLTIPGATAFTRICSGASSLAADLVMVMTAPFVEE